MTFRVGQKVVCVDASQHRADGVQEIFEGKVYTVRWSGRALFGPIEYAGVRLRETARQASPPEAGPWIDNPDQPFDAARFRPIVERKTDISIFKRALVPGSKVSEPV